MVPPPGNAAKRITPTWSRSGDPLVIRYSISSFGTYRVTVSSNGGSGPIRSSRREPTPLRWAGRPRAARSRAEQRLEILVLAEMGEDPIGSRREVMFDRDPWARTGEHAGTGRAARSGHAGGALPNLARALPADERPEATVRLPRPERRRRMTSKPQETRRRSDPGRPGRPRRRRARQRAGRPHRHATPAQPVEVRTEVVRRHDPPDRAREAPRAKPAAPSQAAPPAAGTPVPAAAPPVIARAPAPAPSRAPAIRTRTSPTGAGEGEHEREDGGERRAESEHEDD